jgi:hypothetical protein
VVVIVVPDEEIDGFACILCSDGDFFARAPNEFLILLQQIGVLRSAALRRPAWRLPAEVACGLRGDECFSCLALALASDDGFEADVAEALEVCLGRVALRERDAQVLEER